ncbi:MAG: exodeoxyribonuclease V subunit alpha, partial [Acinetobacter sp.]
MENEQNRLNMQNWADSLIRLHIAADAQEKSRDLIRQVFQALERGDSCIACSREDAQALQGLLADAGDPGAHPAEPQIAP